MTKITYLEAVKIQARAVVPIVRALEKELGKSKAHELVGQAIAESWADFTVSRSEPAPDPRGNGQNSFPTTRVIAKDVDDEYAVNMTHCAFADYFKQINEPEIGALITCGVDYAVEERMRPDWDFKRTQTLMQGAEHCDFCWTRKS